jgi:hypothetical protein
MVRTCKYIERLLVLREGRMMQEKSGGGKDGEKKGRVEG